MKQNHYLYKITINDNCQKKKKNEVKGYNIESAITAHI